MRLALILLLAATLCAGCASAPEPGPAVTSPLVGSPNEDPSRCVRANFETAREAIVPGEPLIFTSRFENCGAAFSYEPACMTSPVIRIEGAWYPFWNGPVEGPYACAAVERDPVVFGSGAIHEEEWMWNGTIRTGGGAKALPPGEYTASYSFAGETRSVRATLLAG